MLLVQSWSRVIARSKQPTEAACKEITPSPLLGRVDKLFVRLYVRLHVD
jgi:hypothetical protein